MGYEIPYADIGSSNYNIRGTNYRIGSYNNGDRNASYFTTWNSSYYYNQTYRWHFDQWYNVLLDPGSYHNTDNPFFMQFENTTNGTGQAEYEWYDNSSYGYYSNIRTPYIGLVKERDENDNLISLRWLGLHNKPIHLGIIMDIHTFL